MQEIKKLKWFFLANFAVEKMQIRKTITIIIALVNSRVSGLSSILRPLVMATSAQCFWAGDESFNRNE